MNPFTRVSKSHLCPICKHGDWCRVFADGWAECMRVESPAPAKSGGWMHRLGESATHTIRARAAKPDTARLAPETVYGLWNGWYAATDFVRVIRLAESLGVDVMALDALGAAWCPRGAGSWAFPMRDATGRVVGIRLRSESGEKFAVKGSAQGLFLPVPQRDSREVWIVEGLTDTAAAWTLGVQVVGRPSCSGAVQMIVEWLKLNRVKRVVLLPDADGPGLCGAERLQTQLPCLSVTWIPPRKDLRASLQAGLTLATVRSSLGNLVWTQPAK